MGEFFGFLKVFVVCGTIFFITTLVLMALPQSKLRSVGMEMTKWALACGLFLLIPSPVDVVPDVVPVVGWLDDCGYALGAIGAIKSALGDRKRRVCLEQMEWEQLASNARGKGLPSPEEGETEKDAAREAVID